MEISDLKNKKILVLGLSTTGFAAAKFLLRAGANCFLSDSKALEKENEKKVEILEKAGAKLEFNGHTEKFLKGAEFCVLSPSIPPESEVLKLLDRLDIPYFSDLELAFKIKPKTTEIIAITGTNGKTTTTMLISHILSKKFTAPAVGNVGTSPLDYLAPESENLNIEGIKLNGTSKEPDFLVLEASSYQLHYTIDFAPKIAVFCNLTPDHIAWHNGIENYFRDKAKMYSKMGENCHSVLNYDDKRVKEIKTASKVHFFALDALPANDNACIKDGKIYYDNEVIINVNEVPIVGAHNLQNVMCAVIAAKNAGLDNNTIKEGIKSFKAPLHRCEFIATIDGTSYYNDSKATNPEAANVAITAFPNKRTALIAGGRDKNTPLDEFCELIKQNVEKVVLIGEAAERFDKALKESGFTRIIHKNTLEEAIDEAASEKPDVVLFSPACASFDMFKNYEVRGEAFRSYVLKKTGK